MQHQMKVSAEPFEKIVHKEKVIESRLYDEKRQQIAVGDEIEFSQNNHPKNSVRVKVKELFVCQTFEELFMRHEPHLFGGESKEFLQNQVRQFYPEDDEKKNGVVGVQFELIE